MWISNRKFNELHKAYLAFKKLSEEQTEDIRRMTNLLKESVKIIEKGDTINRQIYEIRDAIKTIERFNNENEIEKYLKNKKSSWPDLWIVSKRGRGGFWAMSAKDYMDRNSFFFIPTKISPIKPVSMPGPSNLPHVGPGGPIT
jgi:hypothetical protein